ncbi:MAG: MATE family efflux transporter, partial [Eubacteriales bacterium]|nr:MATE family efflux transporter [Eubacteriales bacterium]
QMQIMLQYAMITMIVVSGVLSLLLVAFSQCIVSVFNSENDMGLQATAVTGLKLYFISTPFVGYNIILATFFTSLEKGLPAHILSVLRGLVLIIPLAFVLSYLWGMIGVWLTYPITEALVALLGFGIYTNDKNKPKGDQMYDN